MTSPTAIVVLNTSPGIAGVIEEVALRACTPDDHPCRLTALARTPFGLRKSFRRLLTSVVGPPTVMYRSEFVARFGVTEAAAPAVYVQYGSHVRPWLSRADIDACATLRELEDLVRQKVSDAVSDLGG